MQSNTTEWKTLLYTIIALRDVEGAQVAYFPRGGNFNAYYYLVTPTASLSNRMDDALPAQNDQNEPR